MCIGFVPQHSCIILVQNILLLYFNTFVRHYVTGGLSEILFMGLKNLYLKLIDLRPIKK